MKTFRLFSMAALALMMAACSSEDNEILQNTQQPGTMHFTATIAAPSGDATTRTAYTEDGTTINVKWKVGDKIALVHNGVVDEAEVKTVDDVTGKATIEATITGSPLDNDDVTLAYPANAVVSATPDYGFPFTPNPDIFDKVKHYQDGTLAYIQDNLDLRMGSGKLAVSGDKVTLKGSVSVSSLICIWKLTLQDNASTPLSATKLTFKNNTDTQAKATSTDGKSVYYLCVVPSFIPDASGTFSFEATVGSDTYYYLKKNVTLAAGKYYQSTVKMAKPTDLSTISSDYQVKNGEVLTGTLANEVKISIADGATVMLDGININEEWDFDEGTSAGITCAGSATIILAGKSKNTVNGLGCYYPGIYVPAGKTLTIMGTGSLEASSGMSSYGYMYGAGIGGGAADDNKNCGNIVIKGGTIDATGGESDGGMGAGIGGSWGSCGNITISGGNVTAQGGDYSAGIGGGRGFEGANGTCGDITISGGTVNATGGGREASGAGIGSGCGQSCGNITISGGTVTAEGGAGGSSAGAGIGGGSNNQACGVITITSGVTSVTATKGGDGAQSIGKGSDGKDITVNIEDGANVTQN